MSFSWSGECHRVLLFFFFFFIFVVFGGDFSVLNGPQVQCTSAACCPAHEKAAMCLVEETGVLDQLRSGVSHRAVGVGLCS